jgi:ribosomal protein S18 acetylase RimI-like enzyme
VVADDLTPPRHRTAEGGIMPDEPVLPYESGPSPTRPAPAVPPGTDVRVETYHGPRHALRPLFELAEDSATELDAYIDAGRVLVAVAGTEIIGHLQLVDTGDPAQAEIKNMAVYPGHQGRGVGRRLIEAAVDVLTGRPTTTLLVATAAAGVGNLRFYQRQGFRMRSIERDAFTGATGYPPGLRIDGIELRDRVWLDRPIDTASWRYAP